MLFRGVIERLRYPLARRARVRSAAQGEPNVPELSFRQPLPESNPNTTEDGSKLVELALALTMVIALGLIVAGVAVLIGT